MMKKLEKGRTPSKITSQQHKKEEKNLVDEKVEYARRSYIKSGIVYKISDKHNSRVNTRGQEFIMLTKANIQHEKKQNIKTSNNDSYAYTNTAHVSHMSYHDFDASYILM
jgi:hypothetical protein